MQKKLLVVKLFYAAFIISCIVFYYLASQHFLNGLFDESPDFGFPVEQVFLILCVVLNICAEILYRFAIKKVRAIEDEQEKIWTYVLYKFIIGAGIENAGFYAFLASGMDGLTTQVEILLVFTICYLIYRFPKKSELV